MEAKESVTFGEVYASQPPNAYPWYKKHDDHSWSAASSRLDPGGLQLNVEALGAREVSRDGVQAEEEFKGVVHGTRPETWFASVLIHS